MREKIYELLYEVRPENDFRDSSDFVDEFLLDSLDILELVSLIEEKFRVEITPDDIIPENFRSVDEIETMIKNNKMD